MRCAAVSPHGNLNSFIVCILSQWNVVIHTVSRKLDLIHLTGMPIYSVFWVSPDYKTSRLKPTLFKVVSCLEAVFSQNSPDLIHNILS